MMENTALCVHPVDPVIGSTAAHLACDKVKGASDVADELKGVDGHDHVGQDDENEKNSN